MSIINIEQPKIPDLDKGDQARDWFVFSTCLSTRELMLMDNHTGDFAVVKDPTKEEWSKAFHAPSKPYTWGGSEDRVFLKVRRPAK
jgi:hypothetical protein